MKKILLIGAFLSINASIIAQNNGNGLENINNNVPSNALIHWKLNGNNAESSHFFGTLNEAHLVFRTYNIERLRITKDGNVGIGVEAPTEKLHIDGSIRLNKDIVFSQYSSPTSEVRFVGLDENGKTHPVPFKGLIPQLYLNDCFPKLPIDENGTPIGEQEYPAPTWANETGKNEPGILYTGVTCPARVGINTKSPKASLHVQGSTYISSSLGIGNATPSNNEGLLIGVSQRNGIQINLVNPGAGKSGLAIAVDNENSKVISAFNSQLNKSMFNIYGNGQVEINALQNDAKILVLRNSNSDDVFRVYGDGSVYSTKVNVKLKENFPDYVFAKDYKLMPLPELERFINENNHLPNIPSATEIEQSGLDLGEMQRLQMEKIEEIMLYLIELKKENEELRKLINETK